MHKPLAVVMFAACFAMPCLADDEPSGPSFDCAKASGAAEKTICKYDDLGWFDRQMTKAYGVAKAAVGAAGGDALKSDQTAFLKERNACPADDVNCITHSYERRLQTLAAQLGSPKFTAGSYASDSGGVDAVTYPDASASLLISTVINDGQFTCSFSTSDARAAPGGGITAFTKPEGDYKEACKVKVTAPDAKGHVVLSSSGDACQYYCGAAISLDGEFDRFKP